MATGSGFQPRPFQQTDLKPADVLLSCGTEPISRFICEMDKGIYSHAAVWDGQDVVEATTGGVCKCKLEDEIAAQRYVDVYRWRTNATPEGEMMGEGDYSPKPVTDQADQIAAAGEGYSYSELLLGALVIWTSRRPKSARLRITLRLIGDRIEHWIRDLIANPSKQGTTCTEVVCRSFREARQPPDYCINVRIGDDPRYFRTIPAVWLALTAPVAEPAAAPAVTGHDDTARKFGALFLLAVGAADDLHLQLAGGLQLQSVENLIELRGDPFPVPEKAPLSFVTPRELQNSPNLVYMGRLPGEKKLFFQGSVWLDMFGLVWGALVARLTPYAPIPLRLSVGGLMLWHGIANFVAGLPEVAVRLHLAPTLAALVIGGETLGGAGILAGVFTRGWAAVVALATIIVALRIPGASHNEVTWMLLASALSLVLLGDGALSLRGMLRRRNQAPEAQ